MSRHRRVSPFTPDEAVQRPTLEDPVVAEASELIGGPVGARALPHRWWTPVRIVVAVACATFMLGMLQKTPCVSKDWNVSDEQRYGAMCYSDVPYLYAGRGFAERVLPFTDTDGRYRALEYPVLIGYFAYGSALVTHFLEDWPDLAERQSFPKDEVYRAPGVDREKAVFFIVTTLLLALFALGAAFFFAKANRGRPWDVLAYAASPALLVAGLINWDYLALFFLAAALYAWSRGRSLLSGILIGLGTATKLYPLFLLGALLIVCLRRRQIGSFAAAVVGTVGAWLVVNLPAMLTNFDEWKLFWTFNQERGADFGSIWLVIQQATDKPIEHATINLVSEVFFGVLCLAVLLLGLLARRTPRIAQLAFLIVCGFLLLNKVYSPQYVMWLLPLAVLARPRWRDLVIWQAAELFYFASIWWYLGKFTEPSAAGADDRFYWIAVVVRILAEVWFMGMVVRDILFPWNDPVRADGVTDDPLHPEPDDDHGDREDDEERELQPAPA
ncbi:MAG TPA: glycosyltransferase 87 family protein [Nocardioidaceae bacterium]|nr:glycosyltransferase 87 family protein [Nocardioidaceae bacterium]